MLSVVVRIIFLTAPYLFDSRSKRINHTDPKGNQGNREQYENTIIIP